MYCADNTVAGSVVLQLSNACECNPVAQELMNHWYTERVGVDQATRPTDMQLRSGMLDVTTVLPNTWVLPYIHSSPSSAAEKGAVCERCSWLLAQELASVRSQALDQLD
jgi:hypothetical protein